MFDVLRSDRSISSNGLEPRTPFLDKSFVQVYHSIPPHLRCHNLKKNCEKYLLRKSFDNSMLLPKEILFRKELKHVKIKEIRGKGLMLAIELERKELAKRVVEEALKKGLILFYFLFTKKAIRVTPPLTISKEEIIRGCEIIINNINND